jgi:hypothetical protein
MLQAHDTSNRNYAFPMKHRQNVARGRIAIGQQAFDGVENTAWQFGSAREHNGDGQEADLLD